MDALDRLVAQWQRERPELDTVAMEVFGRVYRVGRHAAERLERIHGRAGVSRTEFDVLAALRRAGPPFRLNQRALAATMMLTTGGMTGCLDRLERAGLVRRSPDPQDRRSVLVELTEKARGLVDATLPLGLGDQQEVLSVLSDAEQRQLADLLRRVLQRLEESTSEGG